MSIREETLGSGTSVDQGKSQELNTRGALKLSPLRKLAARTLLGGVIILIALIAAIFAGLLTTYSPTEQITGAHLLSPSAQHWLGTDELNRDVFTRVLYGIRTSLLVAFIAVPLGALAGTALGLVAVTWRWADVLTARLFDVVLAFPALILAITVTAIRGPGLVTVIIAIAIAEVPLFGRLVRTEAERALTSPFVEVSRIAGAGQWWVLTRHVLPSIIRPLSVQAALSFSLAIFVESAMSFLGVGIRPPDSSLGVILAEGIYNWDVNPGYALGPLAIISALSLAFLVIARSEKGEVRA